MDNTNPCFNPKTFTPKDTPLLSLGQWQMLQLYLVDAQNLRLTSTQMPFPDVLAIYIKLNREAINFHGNVLPNAQSLGNKLYNYGQTAARSFQAVATLMGDSTPNKEAILQLLSNLKSTAVSYQGDSETVFTGISNYITATSQEVADLKQAVKQETAKAGADSAKLTELQAQYQSDYADKQSAQAKITHDENVINSTKYYSWIPFVGTAVAVGEIVAKEKDIKIQLQRIETDVSDMQALNQQMQALHQEIAELNYTAQYNTKMSEEISNAMTGLNLIKGAWGTIVTELGDVIDNIQRASSSSLKGQKCLASVYLTTAVDEWQQVASDAQSFANNFYLEPKSQAVV